MKRRTFLKFAALSALLPIFGTQREIVAASPPISGQFVFDGVNGLTFPATNARGCLPSATRIVRLRALTFFEKLFGGRQ